jgi:subtilisin-like proprotein convertase family protein
MKITSATAGLPPNDATNTATTYSAKTNNKNQPKKITAALNSAMPAGMTLTVDLVAPSGAVDDGVVTLDATAREVVGNITNTNTFTGQISYALSASPAAGVVLSQSRIVTFTLTSWP